MITKKWLNVIELAAIIMMMTGYGFTIYNWYDTMERLDAAKARIVELEKERDAAEVRAEKLNRTLTATIRSIRETAAKCSGVER